MELVGKRRTFDSKQKKRGVKITAQWYPPIAIDIRSLKYSVCTLFYRNRFFLPNSIEDVDE